MVSDGYPGPLRDLAKVDRAVDRDLFGGRCLGRDDGRQLRVYVLD